jgi:formamidopyrimidine-DNA glycosylase
MPELPEVETVVRGLRAAFNEPNQIVAVEVSGKKLRVPCPPDLPTLLLDRRFTNINRRAKYILITLDNGQILVFHLGMSGRLTIAPQNPTLLHDHVKLRFNSGHWLVYNDPRRFGGVTLIPHSSALPLHPLFRSLGIEPLTPEFTADILAQILNKRTGNIKSALMNANLIVGVGNIYACEALFRAGIHPMRPAGSLSSKECEQLVGDIKSVLEEAIISGGSTLRDYVRSSGDPGYFQHSFKVYGRHKKPCEKCNSLIENLRISGRSTFYCGRCQR